MLRALCSTVELLLAVCIGVRVRVRDDRPLLHCVGECLTNKMCVGVKRPRQEEEKKCKVYSNMGVIFASSVFSCWYQQND